tara:strand:- start:9084 stop:11543 length:2460 start_codon:yes stop_codon:yes gene_type:complete
MPSNDRDAPIVERGQRPLGEGESVLFDDEGSITQAINHNGVTYRNRLTSENGAADTLNASFDFTEDSIGGSNFTLDIGLNAVVVKDNNNTQRALFGQITSTGYGLQAKDAGGNEIIALYGSTNKISGWTLTQGQISNTSLDGTKHIEIKSGNTDNLPKVSLRTASTETLAMGMLANNLSGLKINDASGSQLFRIDSAGVANIAGWEFNSTLFKSASTGARIELNASKNRVSIFDSSNEKVVMGYLNGLAKNDSSGNWGSNDYGFWALAGDSLTIDGDMTYESGDWMVENDASLRIRDGNDKEVLRLGTRSGTKGLFIGSDIENVTPLAEYSDTQILIGDASGQHLKYTTASGLEITGDITVSGDTSNSHYETFQLGAVGNNVSYLPSSQYTIVGGNGGLKQIQTATGMGFYDGNINQVAVDMTTNPPTFSSDGWDCGFFVTKEFKRIDVPVMTWDIRLDQIGVNADPDFSGTYDNRYEMIGWNKQKASANFSSNMMYGLYFSNNDIYWWGNSAVATVASNVPSTGITWRLVIQLTPSGAVGRVYKNGDFTTPFSSQTFTNDSSTNTFYASALQRNGQSAKLNHQQLAIGNVSPSVPTKISGGLITTGKIQSTDAKTFFDLDNDKLVVNDSNNDRIALGDVSSSNNGSKYGLKIAHVGFNAHTATNEQLIFNSDFPIPKRNNIYSDVHQIPYDSNTTLPTSYTSDTYWLKNTNSSDVAVIAAPFIVTRDMKKIYLEATGYDDGTYKLRIEAFVQAARANSTLANTTDATTGVYNLPSGTSADRFTISVDITNVAIGTKCVATILVNSGKILMPQIYWMGE